MFDERTKDLTTLKYVKSFDIEEQAELFIKYFFILKFPINSISNYSRWDIAFSSLVESCPTTVPSSGGELSRIYIHISGFYSNSDEVISLFSFHSFSSTSEASCCVRSRVWSKEDMARSERG